MSRVFLIALIALLSIPVFAQDDVFQVHYAANLNLYDSVINISNTGATVVNGAPADLCENVYVFDPSEEEIACCTCSVTPDGLESISVKTSLISNPDTPAIPASVEVELVTSTGTCNASVVSVLAHGTVAWMTTTHALTTTTVSKNWFIPPTTTTAPVLTETPFTLASLTAAELAHLTSTCGFIQANDSGFGICKGCTGGGK